MKVVRRALSILVLTVVLFSIGSNFSSCKKTVYVHDTTTIHKTDTVTLHKTDTVTVVDSSNCNCYNLSDGLIAYYNFNGGNLNDSSGNANHIILNNGATKTTDRLGRADNAYFFDGSSNYMKVANSASLNPDQAITMMSIIKIKSFYAANCVSNQVFGKGWNDFINGYYSLRFYSTVGCGFPVDTAKEVFYCAYGDLSGRPSAIDTNYLRTNRWYNVVYTYANGVYNLYIDGQLKLSGSKTAVFTANNQELYIGRHGDPSYPYYFSGAIDEIRIYNKALCAAAVKQLYNQKQ